MKSILNAANVSDDQDEFIMGKLPEKPGEVSIMTIEEAYKALGSTGEKRDPSPGYESSTYYMYGIVGSNGTESTSDNLQAIGLDWYKRLNKPMFIAWCWQVRKHKVFGGPLDEVYRRSDGSYSFTWYYSDGHILGSYGSDYWHNSVDSANWDESIGSSIYVAVVHS